MRNKDLNKQVIKSLTALTLAIMPTIALITPVLAIEPTQTLTPKPTTTRGLEKEKQLTERATALKTRAIAEIDRRKNSLNELNTKISERKRLTSDEKSKYKNEIQSEIENLNTLALKIQNDTDLATLQADVKSIVESYRVYAVYMPQQRILVSVEIMSTASDQLSTLAVKLKSRIDEVKAKGNDAATLEVAYDDMITKIADAKTQYQAAETAVKALTPAGYPGNKTVLESARSSLRKGSENIKSATADAKKIRDGLKTIKPTIR